MSVGDAGLGLQVLQQLGGINTVMVTPPTHFMFFCDCTLSVVEAAVCSTQLYATFNSTLANWIVDVHAVLQLSASCQSQQLPQYSASHSAAGACRVSV